MGKVADQISDMTMLFRDHIRTSTWPRNKNWWNLWEENFHFLITSKQQTTHANMISWSVIRTGKIPLHQLVNLAKMILDWRRVTVFMVNGEGPTKLWLICMKVRKEGDTICWCKIENMRLKFLNPSDKPKWMTGNPAMHHRQKAVLKLECMAITKMLAQFHPTMDPALKKLGFENGLGLSVRGSLKLTSRVYA